MGSNNQGNNTLHGRPDIGPDEPAYLY